MPDLKRPFDQTVRGVPLHHANMVRCGKDDGIAFGFVEESGFLGEDFAGVFGLLDVVDSTRAAAVLGARGEFPPEPGRVENRGWDAGRALPMNQMTGKIDVDPRIPPPGFAGLDAGIPKKLEHVANRHLRRKRLLKGKPAAGGVADRRIDIQREEGAAVLRAQFLDAVQTGVFLKSSATALIVGDHDLDIVFDQHADGGKIDLTEHRLHQAPGQQRHARPGRLVQLHQPLCVGGSRFRDGGLSGEDERMRKTAFR